MISIAVEKGLLLIMEELMRLIRWNMCMAMMRVSVPSLALTALSSRLMTLTERAAMYGDGCTDVPSRLAA
jgi:hypothetical protein